MSYNKITDPISGKKILLKSSAGKKILSNYIKLQLGGAYYDKFLGKIDRPLFGPVGLWGKYWDFATKNIHVHKTTSKGIKFDMDKTKTNFRKFFDNNLDEAINMIRVFIRAELYQLLSSVGHKRKARQFITRSFMILDGYKHFDKNFNKQIETDGLLKEYETYQNILTIEKNTLENISYDQALRNRVIELLSLNLEPGEKIEDYTNNSNLKCVEVLGKIEKEVELGGGSNINSEKSTVKKLNEQFNLLDDIIFDLMWKCLISFGLHMNYIPKYPRVKIISNKKFIKLAANSYTNIYNALDKYVKLNFDSINIQQNVSSGLNAILNDLDRLTECLAYKLQMKLKSRKFRNYINKNVINVVENSFNLDLLGQRSESDGERDDETESVSTVEQIAKTN